MPEPEQEVQEEEVKEEEVKEEVVEEKQEEEPPAWAKKIQEDQQTMFQKMENLSKLSTQPQPKEQAPQEKPKHEEWTWDQIEAGYDKIESGEWGANERRQLRQIERDKIKHEATSVTKQEANLDNVTQSWVTQAQEAWAAAEKDMPELKDKESPLYKRARDLFLQDPGSEVFIEGNKDINNLKSLSRELKYVNPRLMATYARQAKFELEKSKPISKGKKGAKTALQGESMDKAEVAVLDKLREEAENSDDPVQRQTLYRQYFREQEKQRKLKQASTI